MRALAELLSLERFGVGAPSLGAELEMSDGRSKPAARGRLANERVLADTFDLRFNRSSSTASNWSESTPPVALARMPFSSLGKQLDECLARLGARHRRQARARIALTGNPADAYGRRPGVLASTCTCCVIAPCSLGSAAGGGGVHVRIDGEEPLDIHDDVTYEGANTSGDPPAGEPVRVCRRTTPCNSPPHRCSPSATNSPILGHRLWQETRVELFKQAVTIVRRMNARGARAARVLRSRLAEARARSSRSRRASSCTSRSCRS